MTKTCTDGIVIIGSDNQITGGTGSLAFLQVQGGLSKDTQSGYDSSSVGLYRYNATDTFGEGGVGGPNIVFNKSRNDTFGAHGAVTSGDECGRLRFAGSNGTQFTEIAMLRSVVDGSYSGSTVPGKIEIWTHSVAAGTRVLGLTVDSNQVTTAAGNFAVSTKFTVDATSGNTTVAGGTLFVTGGQARITASSTAWGIYTRYNSTTLGMFMGGNASSRMQFSAPTGASVFEIGPEGETRHGGWTTALRPVSPTAGTSGYNSTLGKMEYYNGTTWIQW